MSKAILEGLANGTLTSRPNTDPRFTSPVYQTFNKIFHSNEEIVENWYSCTKCFHVFHVVVSNGNKKLRTHFNLNCQQMEQFKIPEGIIMSCPPSPVYQYTVYLLLELRPALAEFLHDIMKIGQKYGTLSAEELLSVVPRSLDPRSR